MNIFVGCSARDTHYQPYNEVAQKLGEFIVEHKHNLVFGGCECGLMGQVYQVVVSSKNSKITAIQAKAYQEQLETLVFDEAFVLDTVNERKNTYIKHADVLVFLPGGIGTIDEILTAIETRRNHEHNLPIIIINVDNYFAPFLKMMNVIYQEGFADIKDKECYFVASSIEEAKEYLQKVEMSHFH